MERRTNGRGEAKIGGKSREFEWPTVEDQRNGKRTTDPKDRANAIKMVGRGGGGKGRIFNGKGRGGHSFPHKSLAFKSNSNY